MKKHPFYDSEWLVRCRDKNGNILWEKRLHNDLVDEGERSLLMTYFRAEELPAQFYVRLAYDTISLTDGLGDVQQEASGNGYAPQLVERSAAGFPTVQQVSGDWQISTKQITFTAAGGDIGPFNVAYLATTLDNSGKLIAVLPFNTTQIIGDGTNLEIVISTALR